MGINRLSYFFKIQLLCLICTIGCSPKINNTVNFVDNIEDNNINIDLSMAVVDNLNRLYIVDRKNRIYAYGNVLKEQYSYANNRFGRVSDLDANNPLRLLVFYDDFNYLKILDNTLTEIIHLPLNDFFNDVSAVGSANDGLIWIYDPTTFLLHKINDRGQVMTSTSNVNDFGIRSAQIAKIRESGNFVVLMDVNQGFYVFDNFAQYLFRIPVEGQLINFYLDDQQIYYTTNSGLSIFDLKQKRIFDVNTPSQIVSKKWKDIILKNKVWYGIFHDGIKVIQN